MAIYKVDFKDERFCLLFSKLKSRIEHFLADHDEPTEFANGWLARVLNNDPNLFIYIELDERFDIISHHIFEIQIYKGQRVAFVYQTEACKKQGNTFVQECLALNDQMKQLVPDLAKTVIATRPSRAKAFEKKYGFEAEWVIMTRPINHVEMVLPTQTENET